MNQFIKGILCGIFFISLQVQSQNTQGVQIPKTLDRTECKPCMDAFRQKPKEVYFSIEKGEREALYFEINVPKWLKTLFKSSKDGLLIDMVSKDRYDCSLDKLKETNYGLRGTTTPFISGKRILSGLKKGEGNSYRVKIGVVPPNLRNKELEFNIYFIKDNFFCYYSRIYNLKSYDMKLLDPGMYLDSLTYASDFKKPIAEEGFKIKYKKLKFVIPFEKNKAEYSQEDIKPMYDSLQLTNFDIKKIKIKAYSSVEGTLERNVELQESRAKSIAEALQTFQKPTHK